MQLKHNLTSCEIEIKNVIVLAHINDKYKKFSDNFNKFLKDNKNNAALVYELSRVSKGKTFFSSKEVRDFYKENKEVIDIINTHTSIHEFIISTLLKEKTKYLMDELQEYIEENIDNVQNIIDLLTNISTLGFEKMKFNKDFDFTCSKYSVREFLCDNTKISYLDNMKAIPSYGNITYKSTSSNYEMVFGVGINKITCEEIKLNSLLFDKTRLPSDVSYEAILKEIKDLANDVTDTNKELRDALYLGVNTTSLINTLNTIKKVVINYNDEEKRKKLELALSSIDKSIENIDTIRKEHIANIINQDKDLSETYIDEQIKSLSRQRFL